VDCEIYHPTKFHRSTSNHARDIRYQNPADRQNGQNERTKKTGANISPACLSACGDNK